MANRVEAPVRVYGAGYGLREGLAGEAVAAGGDVVDVLQPGQGRC